MTTTNLLDHLQEQGYEPQDTTSTEGEWFDLTVSGTGTVRVCLYPDDGYSARIIALDATMACEWDAKFDPNVPDAVILATVEAAEWHLAAKRGGPVTPAQAARA